MFMQTSNQSAVLAAFEPVRWTNGESSPLAQLLYPSPVTASSRNTRWRRGEMIQRRHLQKFHLLSTQVA